LVDFLAGRIGKAGDRLAGRRVGNRIALVRARIAELSADKALNGFRRNHAVTPTGLGSPAGTPWNAERRRNWPAPLTPWNFPSRTRTLPRWITTSGRPFTVMPASQPYSTLPGGGIDP